MIHCFRVFKIKNLNQQKMFGQERPIRLFPLTFHFKHQNIFNNISYQLTC